MLDERDFQPGAEGALTQIPLTRRVLAEFMGTAALLIAVVGSGIMAQRLTPGDVGLELLENSTATAAALVAIILAIGPVSGAHLNPVVSLADRLLGGLPWGETLAYWLAQFAGGLCGTVIANLMFSFPPFEISTRVRFGPEQWLGEVVATLGLVLIIFGVVRSGRTSVAPFAVGAYIGAAYWFTSSTSLANPAVTVARVITDTFAGIAPGSVVPFILAQLVAGVLAVLLIRRLYPRPAD
jgi:glycerol uptake facilitator-like aquaporin